MIFFSRDELLEWFIDLQLSEYTHLFDSTEDVAWLDKLNQRYAWFKRQLLQCEEKFRDMFPVHWELSERIAVEFCKITKYVYFISILIFGLNKTINRKYFFRNELSKLMSKRKNEIDVKLLLYAIQKTVAFENLMAKTFRGSTIVKNFDNSMDTTVSNFIFF